MRADDDAVLVAVEPGARGEGDLAEGDGDVDLAGAVLGALAGLEPRALIPRSRAAKATVSRTAPLITTPDQPEATAEAAIMSPIRAVRSEPAPSTTRTRPSPGVASTFLTRALSSRQRMVATGPAKRGRRPYERNCVTQLARVSPWASMRSAVVNSMRRIVADARMAPPLRGLTDLLGHVT
nr:hypothetical protein GCM10020093_060570 [Planobispora longispora]